MKPKDILEHTPDFWEELFSPSEIPNFTHPSFSHLPQISMIDHETLTMPFTMDELNEVIDNLTTNSAPGLSGISYSLIKAWPEEIKELFLKLLNKCFETGTIPENWNIAIVKLIYKNSGNPTDPSSYRPIALLECEYKILSSLLNKRLLKTILKYNLIPLSQNGFLPERNTIQCIKTLTYIIDYCKNKSIPLHAAFIDLSKAYDSVQHWAIIKCLQAYNFPTKFIRNIQSILSDSLMQFITPYGLSRLIHIQSGVKQGDVISPTLFILLLSTFQHWLHRSTELGIYLNNIYIHDLAFADDIVLLAHTPQNLQKQIDKLIDWCQYLSMSINPKKSAHAWMDSSPSPPIGIQSPQGLEPFEALGNNKPYKYLGFEVQFNLNWKTQLNKLEDKYKEKVNIITKKKYLHLFYKINMINTVAIPSLAYRMWTTNAFKKSIGISRKSDSELWFQMTKLKSIERLAISTFINSHITQVLRKPHLLTFQLIQNDITTDYFISSKEMHRSNPSPQKLCTVWNKAKIWDCVADLTQVLNMTFIDTWQSPPPRPSTFHQLPSSVLVQQEDMRAELDKINIFTDASISKLNQTSGAWNIIIQDPSFNTIKKKSGQLPSESSSTAGELMAIEAALRMSGKIANINIYTDSKIQLLS